MTQPGGGGGGASTIADGADVAEGALADAAVTGDNTGSVTAKLRGLSKMVADVWDSVTHALGVKQIGTWTVTTSPVTASAATFASVASSATFVTLQALNASRKGWTLYNDSTAVLYIKFGNTASATSYNVQLAAAGYFEMPTPVTYTGLITGIWASANGNARVMEL